MSTQYNPNTSNNPDSSEPTADLSQPQSQPYEENQYGYGQGQFAQPTPPVYAPLGSPTPAVADTPKHGFINALFDFSFSRYVTIEFAKLIYMILLVLIGIFWVIGLGMVTVGGFQSGVGDGFLALVLYLVGGTIGAFIATVFTRIGLEFYVALVKTAQNTSRLVEQNEARAFGR